MGARVHTVGAHQHVEFLPGAVRESIEDAHPASDLVTRTGEVDAVAGQRTGRGALDDDGRVAQADGRAVALRVISGQRVASRVGQVVVAAGTYDPAGRHLSGRGPVQKAQTMTRLDRVRRDGIQAGLGYGQPTEASNTAANG